MEGGPAPRGMKTNGWRHIVDVVHACSQTGRKVNSLVRRGHVSSRIALRVVWYWLAVGLQLHVYCSQRALYADLSHFASVSVAVHHKLPRSHLQNLLLKVAAGLIRLYLSDATLPPPISCFLLV